MQIYSISQNNVNTLNFGSDKKSVPVKQNSTNTTTKLLGTIALSTAIIGGIMCRKDLGAIVRAKSLNPVEIRRNNRFINKVQEKFSKEFTKLKDLEKGVYSYDKQSGKYIRSLEGERGIYLLDGDREYPIRILVDTKSGHSKRAFYCNKDGEILRMDTYKYINNELYPQASQNKKTVDIAHSFVKTKLGYIEVKFN